MKKIRKLKYVLGILVVAIALFIYIHVPEWELINKFDAIQHPGQHNVVARDSYAYYIAENEMVILEVSDPTNVEIVSTYSNEVRLTDIALYEDFAVLSSLDTGLLMVNISNPEVPELAGIYPKTGDARFSDILVNDGFAFVDDRTNQSIYNQITILDITDPTQIREVSHITDGGKPLAVRGNYLYAKGEHVEDSSVVEWLNIIDISDIKEPKLMFHSNSFGTVLDAEIKDHYLYIGTPDDIVITDISNPTAPVEVSRIKATARELLVQGDFIYYMSFSRVGMLDITDAGKPILIAINREVQYTTDMAYSTNHVYFVGGSPGLLYVFEGGGK